MSLSDEIFFFFFFLFLDKKLNFRHICIVKNANSFPPPPTPSPLVFAGFAFCVVDFFFGGGLRLEVS